MRSAFGESSGFALGPRPSFWPSRGKMRSSIPPASARRARAGRSGRQSDDRASEMTRILAGPSGWAASDRIAPTWASVRRVLSYLERSRPLKSIRFGPSHQPASRARFSGVPVYVTYWSKVMPCEKRSAVTAPRVRPLTRSAMGMPRSGLHFHEGAQPPMEGRGAARHHTRLEHLEDLLPRGAQADGALHVRDEAGPLRPPEGKQRDGHELPHLCGDVLAVSQAQLVEPVIGLDELRILAGRELPLRVDIAPRLLHPRDQSIRPLRTALVARCRLAHCAPPCEPVRGFTAVLFRDRRRSPKRRARRASRGPRSSGRPSWPARRRAFAGRDRRGGGSASCWPETSPAIVWPAAVEAPRSAARRRRHRPCRGGADRRPASRHPRWTGRRPAP